jgi:hypothetical protein
MDSRHGKAHAISVNETEQQIRIHIQQPGYTITTHFVEARDFNVTVCMLGKSGFTVNKHDITMEANLPGQFRPPGPATPSSYHPGSLLSTFMPFSGLSFDDNVELRTNNYVSLLQNDGQGLGKLSQHLRDPVDLHQHTQQVPCSPHFHTVPSVTGPSSSAVNTSYLNPYSYFLGAKAEMYKPRVSSPLRNPTPLGDLSRQSSIFDYGSLFRNLHESVQPITQPCLSQDDRSVGSQDSPNRPLVKNPKLSMPKSTTSLEESSQEETPPVGGDFRKLMPERRVLPFSPWKMKRSKTDSLVSMPMKRQVRESHVEAHSRREHSSVAVKDARNSVPLLHAQTRTLRGDVGGEEKRHGCPEEPSVYNFTKSDTSASQLKGIPEENLSTHPSSPPLTEAECEVLITDFSILRQINEATSKMFDQYLADVARGCDEASCAQYYLDRVYAARRAIWFKELTGKGFDASLSSA